jgi:hypothetical protein
VRVTVRSPLGVYHRIELPVALPAEIGAATTRRDHGRLARSLDAFGLHQLGYSYGEIAAALEIGKTTAFRRVGEAQRHCREVAEQLGTTLAEE